MLLYLLTYYLPVTTGHVVYLEYTNVYVLYVTYLTEQKLKGVLMGRYCINVTENYKHPVVDFFSIIT